MKTAAQVVIDALNDPESDLEVLSNGSISAHSRSNDKRTALLQYRVPDDWIKNITGYSGLRDIYLLMRVPRELFQDSDQVAQDQSDTENIQVAEDSPEPESTEIGPTEES